MKNFTDNLMPFEEKAEILKALSHPIRLCIVRGLLAGERCNVSDMKDCFNIPQSTLSQHLGKLRALGIIKGEKKGVEVYYHVINEDASRVINALVEEN